MKAVCCRAIWKVNTEDVQLARNRIASKRLALDDVLGSLEGVHFFISAITAVAGTTESGNRHGAQDAVMYPAVAYFVAFSTTEHCNEEAIFAALHRQDTEATIKAMHTRGRRKDLAKASEEVFQVVKDHKNDMVTAMVAQSNTFCFQESLAELTEDASDHIQDDVEEPARPRYYPRAPCRIVVVNDHDYAVAVQEAFERLVGDGLVVEIKASPNYESADRPVTGASDLTNTILDIEKVMKLCQQALYRGDVYAKPQNATHTYVKMMDVESYVNKLLANDACRRNVLKYFPSIVKILSHPACEMIQQIEFDYNLIEVLNGYYFHLPSRHFTKSADKGESNRTWSTRAFIEYDPTQQDPQPDYFREGILNSFQNNQTRVAFLNKFYQCLFAFQMPQKVRKLVVAGPKDSGKTSWANVFHRIIPPGKLASITKEGHFSASMIDNETQLVLIDEWSADTLQSDLAKTVLQGGWMVTAVKHSNPRCLVNNSPFYITTNEVPNFGKEDENVKRRVVIFQTKSLPATVAGVDKWIYDHAMDCIAWIAEEINKNVHLVDKEELWYEQRETTTVQNRTGMELFDIDT